MSEMFLFGHKGSKNQKTQLRLESVLNLQRLCSRYDGRLTEVIVYSVETEWVETAIASNVCGKERLMRKTVEFKSCMPAYVTSFSEKMRSL